MDSKELDRAADAGRYGLPRGTVVVIAVLSRPVACAKFSIAGVRFTLWGAVIVFLQDGMRASQVKLCVRFGAFWAGVKILAGGWRVGGLSGSAHKQRTRKTSLKYVRCARASPVVHSQSGPVGMHCPGPGGVRLHTC